MELEYKKLRSMDMVHQKFTGRAHSRLEIGASCLCSLREKTVEDIEDHSRQHTFRLWVAC
jgi:hypothetical protein